MRRERLIAAASLVVAGCTIGPGARFEASRPEGAKIEATVAGSATQHVRSEVRGELLEVRRDALLVLGLQVDVVREGRKQMEVRSTAQRPTVLLLPFEFVQKARFVGLGSWSTLAERQPPSDSVRERLRLLSRFPQGLAPDQLKRILVAQGQPEPRKLGP
jgi:hypothetical protein